MKAKKFLAIFLIAFAGGLFAIVTPAVVKKISISRTTVQNELPVQYASYSAAGHLSPGGLDFVKAAAMSVPAVVHIKTEYEQKSVTNDFYGGFWDPWGFFSDPNYQYKSAPVQISGSGVILSEDGYIVTNNHVVQDASAIEVTLNDNRIYDAKVIGTDVGSDLALIKIDEKGLSFLNYGNSDSVKVGEWVLAVGNPFNLTSTVTAGIISAKARNLNILGKNSQIESFLQTDAAVNPGNSGGALVNTDGQLVGVNAAIASNTGSYLGYSFAIPVNIVKKVVNDLLQYGEVQRAYIGLTFEDIDSKLAKEKGIAKVKGLYVASVLANGAAADAGLLAGDVITKVGNSDVNSSSELQESIVTHSPGDKVVLTYTRNSEEKEVTITLKNKDGGFGIVKKEESNINTLLGCTFEAVSAQDMKKLGISYGLKITNLEAGLLKSAGIKEGFIITGINRKPIRTTADITTAMGNKTGGVLIEGYYENGMKVYYGFGM